MNIHRSQAELLACTNTPGGKNIMVRYGVSAPGPVSLSVIAPSGRTINCLTNKYHAAGMYSLDWKAASKSGVYIFALKTNEGAVVRKAFVVQ
jgi:1,4-alpha-glucan branching enzyme